MAPPGQTPGIDALLDKAGDAVARGDWTIATNLAEAVLTESAHHPEAELILRTISRYRETEAAPNDPFFGSRDLRFMSVMFCDVVGSTRLAGRLGDATWRNTLERFRRRCARAVRRYDGYVHEATGDELLILFGYPRLREDDARRAVLAGLDIVSSIETFAALLKEEHGIDFQVRVGIHTGRALIKERSRGTSPADDGGFMGGLVGESAHIAKRVEAAAEPNTVWVSDATRRIVERFFEFAEPPAGVKRLEISGITNVTAHKVSAQTAALSRHPIQGGPSDELIGRRAHRERLVDLWKQARPAGAPFVLVTGPAGIGKSRLIEFLAETVAGGEGGRLECICTELQQPVAFAPLIGLLERFSNIRQADNASTRLEKLKSAFSLLAPEFTEFVPYLAWMMSIPGESHFEIDELEPEAIRKRIFGHLVEVLKLAGSIRPSLFWIEDLQWADHSTQEFCRHLEAQCPIPGLLVVATMRTGYAKGDVPDAWPDETSAAGRVVRLDLGPLSSEESKEMIAARSGSSPSDALVRAILDSTGGNPLYIQEVVRALGPGLARPSDVQSARPSISIPESLQPIFAQIVDRLGRDRQVAQMASLLGRDLAEPLTRTVIAGILGTPEDEVLASLARLVDAEILEPRLTELSPGHRFRHDLIREALAHSVGPDAKENHGRIGNGVERSFPDYAREHPAVLAYHFTRAEHFERAAGYWLASGSGLQTVAAHEEAIASFEQGIGALARVSKMADAAMHAKLELALVASRGVSIQTIKGYADEQAGKDWSRAYDLARQVEAHETLVPALGGVWSFYFVQGAHAKALEVAAQMIETAHALRDPEASLVAHASSGYSHSFRGDLVAGRESVERSQVLHHLIRNRPPHIHLPQDPGLAGLCLLGPIRWSLGDQVGGKRAADESLALASTLESKRPINLVRTGQFNAWLHQIRHSHEDALRSAEQALAVAYAHRIEWAVVNLSIHKGLAMAHLDRAGQGATDGLPLATQHLMYWRAAGTQSMVPYFLGQLGEAHHVAGDDAAARALLDEAIALGEQTGEHLHDAELYRVRGLVKLSGRAGDRSTGRDDLLKAAATAAAQRAVSFEIRSIVSLLSAVLDLDDRDGWLARLEDAIRRLESNEHGVDEREAHALIASERREHRVRS